MPEVVYALRTTEKPGAIYHVRSAIHNRLQQLWIIHGVVFEIGNLNQHDVSGCFRKSAAQSGALSLVWRLEKQPKFAQTEGGNSFLISRCCLAFCLPFSHPL